MSEGFICLGKPKKEIKKCTRDYIVTVEIKYEYALKVQAFSMADAVRNANRQFNEHYGHGDLFEWLEDEDCYCPNRGMNVKFKDVEFLGRHGE